MSRMRFSLFWQGLEPPDEFAANIAEMERLGYWAVHISDSSLHARDTWIYQTLAVQASAELRVGSLVTNPLTRHVALTANAFATLAELAPGRVFLGMGAGDRPLRELGLTPARLAAVRDAVDLVRRLGAGETVDYTGPAGRLVAARLPGELPRAVPIVISCAGPKAMRLAGEVADVAAVTAGAFAAGLEFARAHVRQGAEAAGRDAAAVEEMVVLACSVRPDGRQARLETRPMAAWYPQTVPVYCELAGVDAQRVEAIQQAYRGGHFDQAHAAFDLVDDAMIDAFTLAGTAAEVTARLRTLADLGVRHVCLIPMQADRMAAVRTVAAEIMPAFA